MIDLMILLQQLLQLFNAVLEHRNLTLPKKPKSNHSQLLMSQEGSLHGAHHLRPDYDPSLPSQRQDHEPTGLDCSGQIREEV